MKITTRIFGDIEIDESKIINFPNGIIGFPELNHFTLMYDQDNDESAIKWLQSIEEPGFAMPVIDPLLVKPDYNPTIDTDKLTTIEEPTPDELLVLTTVTVPHDLTKMTVNLKGPFIINTRTLKAVQTIIEDEGCPVKFPIYDILKKDN